MAITPYALYENLVTDLSNRFDSSIVEPIAPEDKGVRYAAKTLLSTLLKKCITETEAEANDRALALFKQANHACGEWSLQIENMHDEYLVGEFRNEIDQLLSCHYFDDLTCLFSLGRCGPGASIGAKGTDFYTKLFSSPLTATSEAIQLAYTSTIARSPTWRSAESNRHSHYGLGDVVEGSRLSYVPKRNDISRIICVEPTLNMFLQLGYGKTIEDLILKNYGINLSTQPEINRELAQIHSTDGKLSTIDLRSASDSISLKMLKEFLPSHIYGTLAGLRSKSTELPNKEQLELNMVSTMGNGFTFPLQTLIFSAVVSSVYRLNSRRLRKTRRGKYGRIYGNFGVFGDDIICCTDLSAQVIRLLNILGFRINEDKTFTEGLFRESCGGDFYDGYPVRGVYIKSLASMQSRYVAFNRLMDWSAKHCVPLPNTLHALYRTVQKTKVPLFENDDAGLRVPLSMHLRRTITKKSKDNFAIGYKPWRQRNPSLSWDDSKIITPKNTKSRHFNYEGLLLAVIGGYVRKGKINIRTDHAHYTRQTKFTSAWNDIPDSRGFGLEQLYAVVDLNMYWLYMND